MELSVETTMAFGAAIGAWGDELLADPRDPLPASDVHSALLDICIAAKSTRLPARLQALLDDAAKRALEASRGWLSSGYSKARLLEDIHETILELSKPPFVQAL